EVWILGDFGPFSSTGKSIGYQVSIAGRKFLVDCGAPIFDIIGWDEISEIDGLIITHCHDDHKRWFTDIALYYYYSPHISKKLTLITADEVEEELVRSSKPAIDRSLSIDSERMVDIAFEDYVEYRPMGPKTLYNITSKTPDGKRGKLRIVDPDGRALGPDRAKIVLSRKGGRARILFKDPDLKEWIEPETFYSYSSEAFYDSNRRFIEGDGFTIESHKAPVWHGIPGTALKFKTKKDTVLFTSDTVHDVELWERLARKKHEQKLGGMARDDFESSEIIYGDINDFVERIWGPQRFEEAKATFADSAVIQDISLKDSVVHTDYTRIQRTVLDRERTILTHSPDNITTEWALCFSEKLYRIEGNRFLEKVGDDLFPFTGDLYHKTDGKLFIGVRKEDGRYSVYDDEGVLSVDMNGERPAGRFKYKVDLYQDIRGEYFPVIDGDDNEYRVRTDGKVELVKYTPKGSEGTVVKSIREKLGKD
ncbi:MAG: hypothetical protein KAR83_08995, partial [Thermodesulfovibrionales bacterium]|nr:hypothetical protein [Thermodesulfovibrionales bacterium]